MTPSGPLPVLTRSTAPILASAGSDCVFSLFPERESCFITSGPGIVARIPFRAQIPAVRCGLSHVCTSEYLVSASPLGTHLVLEFPVFQPYL